MFGSIDETVGTLADHAYITEVGLSASLFLALRMEKPLFLEGEPGVGKTELDTSVRVPRDALKALVRPFADPSVGLTTGQATRVPSGAHRLYRGGIASMRYESAIRALESRAGTLVGDSGPCYAIRAHLHRIPLPASLSREAAATLHCREWGYRQSSCQVPTVMCRGLAHSGRSIGSGWRR